MNLQSLLSAVGILMLTISAALANRPASNSYWYANNLGQAQKITVSFKCYVGAAGCLITGGPYTGQQLYTNADLFTPLHR